MCGVIVKLSEAASFLECSGVLKMIHHLGAVIVKNETSLTYHALIARK
jgi:hypothetical protein